VSYIYFPPVTVAQVNAGIKCDQGFANAVPVLLQRQYPRWVTLAARWLMLIGPICIVYLLYRAAAMFAPRPLTAALGRAGWRAA
jgi:hypothetical protein